MTRSIFPAAVALGALLLAGAASLAGVLAQDHDDFHDMITREFMRPCDLARSAGLLQGSDPSQAAEAEVAADLIARAEGERAADDGGIADFLVGSRG